MKMSDLTVGQKVRLFDSEYPNKGRQFTFRVSDTATEHLEAVLAAEKLNASALLRVLVREGSKSFLGYDIEEEQQAPAE